jgi:hypothetical protein
LFRNGEVSLVRKVCEEGGGGGGGRGGEEEEEEDEEEEEEEICSNLWVLSVLLRVLKGRSVIQLRTRKLLWGGLMKTTIVFSLRALINCKDLFQY